MSDNANENNDDVGSVIWYNYDLSNEKQYIKCVKHLQRMIRGSMSYDAWQRRSKIGVKECPICNLNRDEDRAKFESHHYPKTLFDVVDEHLQYLIETNQLDNLTDFDVCQEIMDLHFQHQVNYIVLCEYCHKKYHDEIPEILSKIDQAWKTQKETIQAEQVKYQKK